MLSGRYGKSINRPGVVVLIATKADAVQSENKPEYFGKDLEAMSFAVNYHRWILSEFSPYLGESVAEVGAGMGNFSQMILQTGIKSLAAFEPSVNTASRPILLELNEATVGKHGVELSATVTIVQAVSELH